MEKQTFAETHTHTHTRNFGCKSTLTTINYELVYAIESIINE